MKENGLGKITFPRKNKWFVVAHIGISLFNQGVCCEHCPLNDRGMENGGVTGRLVCCGGGGSDKVVMFEPNHGSYVRKHPTYMHQVNEEILNRLHWSDLQKQVKENASCR